jgi:hypothetical protein
MPTNSDYVIPVVWPYQGIRTGINSGGGEIRAQGLGHAGVILVDGDTTSTRYHEYGRYDQAQLGEVRNRSIPNVVIQDGTITADSLETLATSVGLRFLTTGMGLSFSRSLEDRDGCQSVFWPDGRARVSRTNH